VSASAVARMSLDLDAVRKLVDRQGLRALSVLGAVARREAQRLIRRRLRPSRPGEPPSSPTGRLKRTIAYAVDRATRSVVIGPIYIQRGDVPRTLEQGGMSRTDPRWTPARVGTYAPIRYARTREQIGGRRQWAVLGTRYQQGAGTSRVKWWTARTLIRTQAQADRANRILETILGPQGGRTVYIAPRPYMSRALAHVLSRAESILRTVLG